LKIATEVDDLAPAPVGFLAAFGSLQSTSAASLCGGASAVSQWIDRSAREAWSATLKSQRESVTLSQKHFGELMDVNARRVIVPLSIL
jgi:hypothetical protein